MKTVFNMKNLMIMKNYSKYICTFILLMGMNVSVWGVVTTAELNFGTAAVSVNFNSLSSTSISASGSAKSSDGSMSGFTPFTHYYMGTSSNGAQSIAIAESSGAMKSNHMALVITNNGVATSFNHLFKTKGAFSFKVLKTSTVNIGIYNQNAYASGATYFSHNSAAVMLQCTSSRISLSAGQNSGSPSKWQPVTESLPSEDVLEIHVVYNNTGSSDTYGDGISIGANSAHVYINGTAVMDGDAPLSLYIKGNDLTSFRICGSTASTHAKIDDIAIYDALPTKAGDAITLNKNNSDAGSSNGTGTILTDATSMTIDAAPTRTGYTVEGYYTAANDGVKIAAANGALQSNVIVSSTSWTNGSGVWQNVGDKTFYTYWSPIEYIIEYNKNNNAATGTMEDQEFVYGTAQNLSKCGFSREGYTFSGWATTADGSKEYDDEEEVNNLTSTEDDIITLFAVWTPNNYKLTVGAPANVTIKATPDDKSDITEGNFDAAVPCDAIITLDAVVDAGYSQAGWKITKDADGSDVTTTYLYDGTTMFMPPFDVTVTATMYGDFVFSCSELTLTPKLATAGTPIFITSAAGKKVRSQDSILIVGSGLTPSTALTFPDLPAKFEIKSRTGAALATDASGAINAVAYIFYTPAVGDTDDGLDEIAGITVSVGGAKPKTVVLTQDIIGRHLPADFVIAAKRNGKWYALPDTMTGTWNPKPVEIAVDDIDNPTIAYTATTNVYNLYGQVSETIGGQAGYLYSNGHTIKLGMKNNATYANYPLFGSATGTSTIGKGGIATSVTNNIGKQYWWALTQTNTSITNPQDAKYIIYCANNTTNHLRLKDNSGNPKWGLYDSGVEELRLIPASDIVFTEAYFVEWGQHGGVIEVDAQGVAATSVVAHLNGATSSAITLVQTKASDAKNKSSKYNYTVNFGVGIDFAAAASNGAMLTLEWKNGETVKAVSNIVVPKIVASNITINKENYPLKSDWNTEVHVLPGKTVTIDADYSPNPDVTIKELNIYPGATVVASTGTLIATTLVLRNGWSRAGSKTYDVARLHVTSSTATLKATNVYADWYIDYDQYYPIAVPWNATVANFTYRYCTVDPSVGPSENIRMRYYDGASRATNVQEGVGSGANWKQYGEGSNLPVPTTLTPSTGYAMTAKRPSGKAFSIIRMPLTLPSGTWADGSWTTNGEAGNISTTHKDQVSVTAHGTGSTPTYAKGWNFIANPYMSLHQGALSYNDESGDVIEYANVPDINFKEYDQLPIETTKLKPASAFLVQVPKTGTVTFDTGHRKASAPSYRTEEAPQASKQKAYILLSDEEANDMMGLIISDQYTAEYEMNADLEKLLGDGTSLRTYMRYGDRNMAYVAINEMLAKEWIPVTVRIPADGEYTFSLHEASKVSELEGIYLIDYTNDVVTNLIEQSYTFSSTAGTINGRFAINAKAGERQTPTGIDAINAGGDINSDKPFKFIYHDKVYIWLNGIIYDTTGKRVK